MSAIVGFWNLDGRPAEEELLAAMSATLRHRGPDGEGRWRLGATGLACQHMRVTPEAAGERQPVVGPTGSAIVFDGRLDNRDELEARLGLRRPAAEALPDSALALAAYEAWGDAFAAALNGDFAAGVFDPRAPRLLVVRDAVGLRPVYYHCGPRHFAFASEIKALLVDPRIPAVPDHEGLADFLLFGLNSLERREVTCFEGIAALIPGHLAIVTPANLQIREYWDFDRERRLHFASFDECAEAFREHFATAVRRRIRSAMPVAVSVSGGLDSSSIFCQAESLRRAGTGGVPPEMTGISYVMADGSTADERTYLDEIERRYGVSIERIDMSSRLGPVAGAEEQLWHVEVPFPDYLWGLTRAMYAAARARGARVLLSGHWGDQVLFSSVYLVDLARRLAFGEVGRHLLEYRRWFTPGEARVLARRFPMHLVRYHTPDPLVAPLKWVRHRVARIGPGLQVYSAAFRRIGRRLTARPALRGMRFHSAHARALYVVARSKYHVQCMEWNIKAAALQGLETALPMLDRDLLAFLMAVPGEVQNRSGVPRALLRRAMTGVLPDAIVKRSWKADFTALVNDGVDQDFGRIVANLTDDALVVQHGLVDRQALARELASFRENLRGPDCVASWRVADLLGLELWLRVFFGSGSRGSDDARVVSGSR